MLRGGTFVDETDARIEIFDFIESYDTKHRKHSSLGYRSSVSFEGTQAKKMIKLVVHESVALHNAVRWQVSTALRRFVLLRLMAQLPAWGIPLHPLVFRYAILFMGPDRLMGFAEILRD